MLLSMLFAIYFLLRHAAFLRHYYADAACLVRHAASLYFRHMPLFFAFRRYFSLIISFAFRFSSFDDAATSFSSLYCFLPPCRHFLSFFAFFFLSSMPLLHVIDYLYYAIRHAYFSRRFRHAAMPLLI